MTRLARAIFPGHSSHVTQRSNGRAWVLMTHHVHLILVLAHPGGLRLQQGSIVAVTDNAAAILAINSYDEYGVPGTNNVGRFQYTGQAWIPELGMYYYKARFYSAKLGRFLQTDPVGYKGQVNLYAYVGNDPIGGRDPTGTQMLRNGLEDPEWKQRLYQGTRDALRDGMHAYLETGGKILAQLAFVPLLGPEEAGASVAARTAIAIDAARAAAVTAQEGGATGGCCRRRSNKKW